MKEKIVSFFLAKKLKRRTNSTAKTIGVQEVRHILLVTEELRPELMKYASIEFGNAETTLVCKGQNKAKESTPKNVYVLNASDFGMNGSLKSEEVINLVQRRFDIIIDLSSSDIILDYIISKINTKLIIGSASDENEKKIHDIFVPHLGNDETFITQAKETLNLISN